MSNSAEHPLTRWVGDMQAVITSITQLIEDSDRLRVTSETAQQECGELRQEVSRLRSDLEQQRVQADGIQRERDELREQIATLRGENERLHAEQAEAGESAAKLLGEMKDLVNQVAHKFQGAPRSSPFSRDPRSPHS